MESTSRGDKYLPRCPYCEESFPSRKMQSHAIHCRLVLEKCPKGCGVYYTRQQKNAHLSSLCEISLSKTRESDADSQQINSSSSLKDVERNLTILQHKVEDEKQKRLEFEYNWLNEVAKLHERCQRCEEWQQTVMTIVNNLQETTVQEEQWRLKGEIQLKDEVEKLASLARNLETSSNRLSTQLTNAKVMCSTQAEKLMEHFNYWKYVQENRMASLRNIGKELEKLQVDSVTKSKSMLSLIDLNESVVESQEKCTEQMRTCERDIQQFKQFLSKENVMVSSLWYQQQDKLLKIEEDLKNVDKLIRNLTLWKVTVMKRLDRVESLLSSNDPNLEIVKSIELPIPVYQDDLPIYSNGHLLWCVTDFEYHFSESKERNVVLQSPSFYSEEYGYKMQIKLHPNGFGQWKGRHMIITMNVLNCEWDSLLQWPFKMHATVILKDQSCFTQNNDLVKTFGACSISRENDSSKSLRMFVPHRSLTDHAYIKNDTLILEAQVNVIHDVSSLS
ncbi:TNF receptor-associated factor 3 isoform X2 [Nilaparvata lugens]|uniref:TNF receptor-associated factor 3 isoform X2 n=1 Tax=Nilaparvata lugens TaxID=108931 RepID=UPI00193D2DD6|nr:TNF receptor-associated factor 3 isoform X2 [Nilaparvata lugens]